MRLSPLGQGAKLVRARTRRPLSALSDERLGGLVARGDHGAFEALFDRHYVGLLALSRQLLGSSEEAEDATQQAFLSAYKELAGHKQPDRLKAWLYTIARNRCLSMLRARREQPTELEQVAVAGFTEHVEQRAELRSLLNDLAELPENQRSAIVLAEVGDLPHAEIAEVLSVEPKQVKALVFQARSGLSHRRFARDTPCEQFREQIAVSTGGSLLRGPLRRHLGACPHCAEFREEIRDQRQLLSLVLPVMASLTLKEDVMAATGGGAAGASAAVGGGAGGAGTTAGAGAGANGAVGVGAAAKGALATGAAGGAGVGAPVAAPGLAGFLGSAATGGKIAAAGALLSKVGVAQAATVAVVAGGAIVGGGVAIRAAGGGDEADQRSAEKAPGAERTPPTSSTPRTEARRRADERRKQRGQTRSSRSREDARAAGERSERERSKASREDRATKRARSGEGSPGSGSSGTGGGPADDGSSSSDSGPRSSGEERAGPKSTSSSPEQSGGGSSPGVKLPESTSTPEAPKVDAPSVPKAPALPSAPKLP